MRNCSLVLLVSEARKRIDPSAADRCSSFSWRSVLGINCVANNKRYILERGPLGPRS
jgi:hypothetical protein